MSGADARPASPRSVLRDARQIDSAVQLIKLGARLQVLEGVTDLSYERLLRLYKEVAGASPAKGQLPFSTDWFLTWQPNIHASLFHAIYTYLIKTSAIDSVDALVKAYALYVEQISACGLDAQLTVTRAWRLVRFVEANMLASTSCSRCAGNFITEPYSNARHHVCKLCQPPARAGKGTAAGNIRVD